jgi:hypothetical protein
MLSYLSASLPYLLVSNSNEHIPSKMTSQRFSQAWIDKEVKQLSRKKKRCYQKVKKSGIVRDWNKFKKIKKETQSTCRRTYNSYISNMLSDIDVIQ